MNIHKHLLIVKRITLHTIYYFIILLIISNHAHTAYLKNVPQEIIQPDGKIINCFASGDEFYNYLHDSSGYVIVKNQKNGFFVYADTQNQDIVSTDFIVGQSNPNLLPLKKWIKIDSKIITEIRNNYYNSMEKGRKKPNIDKPMSNNKGTINNIIIFIRFADQTEFSESIDYFYELFNSTTKSSMKSYYLEASYNQLTINSFFYPAPNTTIISYQDVNKRSYYLPYDQFTNTDGYTDEDKTFREHILIENAILSVREQISTSLNLDYNNDGMVDNVCFVVKGSTSAWNTLLWPHRWSLFTIDIDINGKRVYDYNFNIQSYTRVGVLCHEMFHTLGAPDLYHYSQDDFTPVGVWDIMESNTDPPQHMCSFMKYKYGHWIDSIPVIYNDGVYKLNPLTIGNNNCYAIKSPYSTKEYFVVDYRKRMGLFENSLPGSGLIVYRINTERTGNAWGPPDEVYVYRPDGTLTNIGKNSFAFFSSIAGRNAINDTTNPASFLSDGSKGGLFIYDISSPGNTISFKIGFGSEIFSTNSIYPEICKGTDFKVYFQITKQRNTNNHFIAQLSDANGSFNNPTIIGEIHAVNSDSIPVYIPKNIASGDKYRIRVVATNPESISIDNGEDLIIGDRPEIVLNGNTNPCQGSTQQYYIEPEEDANYEWYVNGGVIQGLNNSDTVTIIWNNQNNGNIRIYKERIYAHCKDTVDFNISLISIPVPVIQGQFEVCQNSIQVYSVENQQDNYIYSWKVEGAEIIGDNNKYSITLNWGNSYKGSICLTQTNSYGCSSVITKTITIDELPHAIIIGNNCVYKNQEYSYYTEMQDNCSYSWEITNGLINGNTNENNCKVTFNSVGNSYLKLIVKNLITNCIDSSTVLITIFQDDFIKIQGKQQVCQFDIENYSIKTEENYTYKWIIDGGISNDDLTGNNVNITWTDETKGILTIIRSSIANNSKDTLVINISIQAKPNSNIIVENNGRICPGDTVVLDAGAGFYEYSWSNGKKTRLIHVVAGDYYCNVSSIFGCSASSNTVTIYETNKLNPVLLKISDTLICLSKAVLYEWFRDDEQIANYHSNWYYPTKKGIYKVRLTDTNGCQFYSKNIYLSIDEHISNSGFGIKLSPNPAFEYINIDIEIANISPTDILIYNSIGEKIGHYNIPYRNNSFQQTIAINQYTPGVYTVLISNNGKCKSLKFIKY